MTRAHLHPAKIHDWLVVLIRAPAPGHALLQGTTITPIVTSDVKTPEEAATAVRHRQIALSAALATRLRDIAKMMARPKPFGSSLPSLVLL